MRPTDHETFMTMAEVAAQRSLCSRDQVGAVIVSSDQIVIATGRNGPPRGFRHNEQSCEVWCARGGDRNFRWVVKPDDIYAFSVPEFTVENGKTFVTFGAFGTRKELVTDEDYERFGFVKEPVRDSIYGDCPSLHAEVNAVLSAERSARQGGTIYVTSVVCFQCAKIIANSGINVIIQRATPAKLVERNAEATRNFLHKLNITVITLGEDETRA